jgi:hypothetical protein
MRKIGKEKKTADQKQRDLGLFVNKSYCMLIGYNRHYKKGTIIFC